MTFNPTEEHQARIPALQLLVALGFTPLSRTEVRHLRSDRLRNVALDASLAEPPPMGRLKPTSAAGPGSQHG